MLITWMMTHLEVDSFSYGCYQALSSPCFWGESLGTRLASFPGPAQLPVAISTGKRERTLKVSELKTVKIEFALFTLGVILTVVHKNQIFSTDNYYIQDKGLVIRYNLCPFACKSWCSNASHLIAFHARDIHDCTIPHLTLVQLMRPGTRQNCNLCSV